MYAAAIARICHEANRAYCAAIGDDTQVPWSEAPNWQKESAIDGVVYKLTNPDSTASALHDSWMRNKADTGWSYGEIKDENKKTHPCFVPYDQLPETQQKKDALFAAIVNVLK
jgi:hypothetical protein